MENRWKDINIDVGEYKDKYFKIKSTDDLFQVGEVDIRSCNVPDQKLVLGRYILSSIHKSNAYFRVSYLCKAALVSIRT